MAHASSPALITATCGTAVLQVPQFALINAEGAA
jgi:hypothetical protein